jgi:hypothetical protein
LFECSTNLCDLGQLGRLGIGPKSEVVLVRSSSTIRLPELSRETPLQLQEGRQIMEANPTVLLPSHDFQSVFHVAHIFEKQYQLNE